MSTARPSAPKWPTSSSVIDQMSGASNALEARSADAIAPSAWAEGEMSPQDMEDVVLVIGIGAPLGRGGVSHQMRPIHQNITPRRALPSPHSKRDPTPIRSLHRGGRPHHRAGGGLHGPEQRRRGQAAGGGGQGAA